MQSLKSEKTPKSGLVPILKQDKLVDLFLVFPARHDQKLFIRIPSFKFPEMRLLGFL